MPGKKKARGEDFSDKDCYSHIGRKAKLPKHSAMGAYIVQKLVNDYLDDKDTELAKVVSSAIATHHGSIWPELEEYNLIQGAEELIKEVVYEVLADDPDIQLFLCYLLLVRLLRLADQYSFELLADQSENQSITVNMAL